MIRLDRVSKRYADGTVAVGELTIEVPRGALVAMVGPSGCGKTTTMKMVNRLIEPTEGRIFVDGKDVTHVDPVLLRRGIGYVIQQVGLFPHRTVADNVATVPELLGQDKRARRARARELLALVGLDPDRHGERYPHELSGGQRQRVGVARALAADPPVLLMDEPFSAVDPIVRTQLQDEFLRLQSEVRKTILFVTHDIDEAVRLGDLIAVFRQGGVLEQYDSPAAILGNPANEFVAGFVGSDRALTRLSVTGIRGEDLAEPPVVRVDDSHATGAAVLAAAGSRWGVVLDREGQLRGWVARDWLEDGKPTNGSGLPDGSDDTVGGLARRMEAWVPVDASLKRALSTMLANDAGWVAVLEPPAGEGGRWRYLGVLTPAILHAALRRSIEADIQGVPVDDVRLESVSAPG